jgi:hypothetical protein
MGGVLSKHRPARPSLLLRVAERRSRTAGRMQQSRRGPEAAGDRPLREPPRWDRVLLFGGAEASRRGLRAAVSVVARGVDPRGAVRVRAGCFPRASAPTAQGWVGLCLHFVHVARSASSIASSVEGREGSLSRIDESGRYRGESGASSRLARYGPSSSATTFWPAGHGGWW